MLLKPPVNVVDFDRVILMSYACFTGAWCSVGNADAAPAAPASARTAPAASAAAAAPLDAVAVFAAAASCLLLSWMLLLLFPPLFFSVRLLYALGRFGGIVRGGS